MNATYRLANYLAETGRVEPSVVAGNRVYSAALLTGEPRYSSMLAILEDWDRADALIAAAVAIEHDIPDQVLDATRLKSSFDYRPAIYGAGANFNSHLREALELNGVKVEGELPKVTELPWFFVKAPHAVAPPNSDIPKPVFAKDLGWEIELAVIIGKPAFEVSREEAMKHVAGYAVANDLSARDHRKREEVSAGVPFQYDFHSHKSFENSCPIGPWLIPARDVVDPYDLDMALSINGIPVQNSNTNEMIFDISEQIVFLSSRMTLHPGDIILTGTPAVGHHHPFLERGDVMELSISGLGSFTNRIV